MNKNKVLASLCSMHRYYKLASKEKITKLQQQWAFKSYSYHSDKGLTEPLYSTVPPLRNCIIRNSGLISLNKIPLYKKLSRLIQIQFLLKWYIVTLHCTYLNMSPIGSNSLETRMIVLSQICYTFKKFSVLAQTIRSLYNSAYLKNAFLTIFDSCFEYKNVSYTMVYTPCFEEVYLNIRNQSGRFLLNEFLKGGTLL